MKYRLIIPVLILLIICSVPICSTAESNICTRPRKPYIPYGEISKRSDMERAQEELKQYKEMIEAYLECLSSASKEAVAEHNEVIEEWKIQVEKFNSRMKKEGEQ